MAILIIALFNYIPAEAIPPSLAARFLLWSAAFEDFQVRDLFLGKGYDYFGAAISTVSSEDIRIVDSFYVSSFISGGLLILPLLLFFYFIRPLKKGLASADVVLVSAVCVFFISNFTGNFLENGFPANLVYWLVINDRLRFGAMKES
jgi:hypothetical protein